MLSLIVSHRLHKPNLSFSAPNRSLSTAPLCSDWAPVLAVQRSLWTQCSQACGIGVRFRPYSAYDMPEGCPTGVEELCEVHPCPTPAPSAVPTHAPTHATNSPTGAPSSAPTTLPTTGAPSSAPTTTPTTVPTSNPSAPTRSPTLHPTQPAPKKMTRHYLFGGPTGGSQKAQAFSFVSIKERTHRIEALKQRKSSLSPAAEKLQADMAERLRVVQTKLAKRWDQHRRARRRQRRRRLMQAQGHAREQAALQDQALDPRGGDI
jgi:hypothetical protein